MAFLLSAVQFGPGRHSPTQHPLQILLIFWLTFGSSARISASPGIEGPGVVVPSMRPVLVPPARLPAVPVVIEPRVPVPPVEPEELAVPAAFVPGASGTLAEFPAPLGSA